MTLTLQVVLECVESKQQYSFEYGDWVKVTEVSDGWLEIPVHQDQEEDRLKGQALQVLDTLSRETSPSIKTFFLAPTPFTSLKPSPLGRPSVYKDHFH